MEESTIFRGNGSPILAWKTAYACKDGRSPFQQAGTDDVSKAICLSGLKPYFSRARPATIRKVEPTAHESPEGLGRIRMHLIDIKIIREVEHETTIFAYAGRQEAQAVCMPLSDKVYALILP